MKTKVLIVDDSALIRSVMSEIVNSQPDMEVVATAPDPLVARELIKKHNPDVLTLDVEMPKMDGLTMLQNIRADPALAKLPVLMVTAEAKKENIIAAAQAGASGYVVKPFTAATLDEKLNKIFEKLDKAGA